MKILVLIAGNNEPSNAALLAQSFAAGCTHIPETEVSTIRLRDCALAHFSLNHYDAAHEEEPDFTRLRQEMQAASGLVIASPVWNFSVPAHLKNAIDRMGGFSLDAGRSRGLLKGLPFYLILTGGAPIVAWKSLLKRTTSHVPRALQYFGASHCGTHYEGSCTPARGTFGLVVDQRSASLAHMTKEGERFGRLVREYVKTGKLPVRQSLFTTVVTMVQKLIR